MRPWLGEAIGTLRARELEVGAEWHTFVVSEGEFPRLVDEVRLLERALTIPGARAGWVAWWPRLELVDELRWCAGMMVRVRDVDAELADGECRLRLS